MSSSTAAAAAHYKLDANSNAIALIADAAAVAAAAALPPSPSPTDRIEWSRATILGFIEDYRRQRVLWDPNTKGYHIKQTKYEALKLLSQKYGTEIRSIRSKIKSLRSSFHREHGKVLNGRNRGVNYQPMWFAYEAIRFILDGEQREGIIAGGGALDADDVADVGLAAEAATETAEKLALMHSLDLEQLTGAAAVTVSVGANKQQVELHAPTPAEQHEEFAARVAAAMTAMTAMAAAAASQMDADKEAEAAVAAAAATVAAATNGSAGGSAAGDGSIVAVMNASAAVTRSSSELDGENYCNISAEDVKTEIIEHDTVDELSMLDRNTSTPSPINYYKPTDLTYNHRKRKAAHMDENGSSDSSGERILGALTLTPIKQTPQQQHQMNHNQFTLHALQQHFNHSISVTNHNSSTTNGHQHHVQQHQQQQQQQLQQHSNMAQKRDRDLSPTVANNHSNNTNNNNNHNSNGNNNNNSSGSNPSNNNSHSSLLDAHLSSSTVLGNSTTGSGNSSGAGLTNSSGCSTSKTNLASHVDEYGVFGEYVAITIRKLKTSKSKIVVKHLINNLLYEAELGKYDHGMPASKEPPQLYKMQ